MEKSFDDQPIEPCNEVYLDYPNPKLVKIYDTIKILCSLLRFYSVFK